MFCLCDHAPNTLKKHFSHDENISQELNISPYLELSQTHRHRQTYRQTHRDRHTHTLSLSLSHTHTHTQTHKHTHTYASDLSPVKKKKGDWDKDVLDGFLISLMVSVAVKHRVYLLTY